MIRRKYSLVYCAAVLSLAAAPLFATNGYFTHGQGTANKALGGAGSALPQDALAGVSNPAGLALVDEGSFFSMSLFNPNREYSVEGRPSGYPGTFGLAEGTIESESELFVMPSIAANWSIGESSALGFAFVAHGGMNTDYRTNTFYGGSHTGVDLGQGFFNTTFAHRLSPRHSIGVTGIVAVQRFKAQGLHAFGMFSKAPASLTNREYDVSYGVGMKVGYLGQLTDRLSIGAAWSPKIEMSELDSYAGLFSDGGSFDIPASGTLGAAFRLDERFTLVADVERIEYSGVESVANPMLPNLMTGGLGGAGAAGFGWKDMTIYKAGIEWALSERWQFRGGYSHGKQPIPASEVMFNILAPAVIEDHLTAGFSRRLAGGGLFNFALMYAPENSVRGANPMEAPGQQSISLTMDEWEAEFSYSFRF